MKKILLSGVLLSGLALAATQTAAYFLTVNGQPSSLGAATINGVPYVPLETLKQLGIPVSISGKTITLGSSKTATTAGGINQRASLEGCVGQTLFNGIWRLTVKSVKPITRYNGQQAGYSLNLEWKNGTPRSLNPQITGVKTLTLALADGNTLDTETYQDLTLRNLPQAAGITLNLPFYATSSQTTAGLAQPAKLLIEIDPKVVGISSATVGLAYSTPTPSFRVNLTCQK